MRFLSRRLIHAALVLFGVSILTFLFTSLAPGDYFDEMRLNPQIAPETVAALRTVELAWMNQATWRHCHFGLKSASQHRDFRPGKVEVI